MDVDFRLFSVCEVCDVRFSVQKDLFYCVLLEGMVYFQSSMSDNRVNRNERERNRYKLSMAIDNN